MTMLVVIPARGGSKGIPGKNLRPLAGKPLIEHTIEVARRAGVGPVLLTTDDQAIVDTGLAAGAIVPFLRPDELATDAASTVDVVLHAVGWWESNREPVAWVCLLQPTSPLRVVADVKGAAALALETGADVIGVVENPKPPEWLLKCRGEENRLSLYLEGRHVASTRQAGEKTFIANGAVYVCATGRLRAERGFLTSDTRAWVMPPERSVDIDSSLDWVLAEALLEGRLRSFATVR